MSIQLFELVFFAIVAFLIINKLIATLGTTNEEDVTKYKSYFGESGAIKDVTNNIENNDNQNVEVKLNILSQKNLENTIEASNKENILKALSALQARLPSFTPDKFLRGAKSAVKLILESVMVKDKNALSSLIDKRYLEQFDGLAATYGQIINLENLQGKISDIYMFGNNVFVKTLFTGNNITSKQKIFAEEWTFTKSLIVLSPNWYLTNIEKAS